MTSWSRSPRYESQFIMNEFSLGTLVKMCCYVYAYPKLVAQRYANGHKYKADERKKQNADRKATRERIILGVETHACRDYGLRVRIDPRVRVRAIADPTGDTLDAILCAVQAAWSQRCHAPPDGIPPTADPLEGWIVDPGLVP